MYAVVVEHFPTVLITDCCNSYMTVLLIWLKQVSSILLIPGSHTHLQPNSSLENISIVFNELTLGTNMPFFRSASVGAWVQY